MDAREPAREIVAWNGSNHLALLGRGWEPLGVVAHRMPEEPFPYFDEMLIRLSGGDRIGGKELRGAMEMQLRFHRHLVDHFANPTPGVTMEQLLWHCREHVERGN